MPCGRLFRVADHTEWPTIPSSLHITEINLYYPVYEQIIMVSKHLTDLHWRKYN